MSDTPRTDSAEIHSGDEPAVPLGMVEADFARALERELAAANAHIKRLEDAGDAMAETTTTPDAIAWRRAKGARP